MKGPDPVDDAGERRIPRGGSLQESEFRVWPAAIDPQTPTVPGAKRPPGFSHHSGGTRGQRGQSPHNNQAGHRDSPRRDARHYAGRRSWGDQASLGPG
jgi:hypothetical protein